MISIDCLKDLNILRALMEKFNYNINIRRKQISTFLNLNTKPIAVKDKILLKTKNYDVRYKNDKKKFIYLVN